MQHFVRAAACLGLLITTSPAWSGATCDPTTEPDRTDVANARAAVAANCDCPGVLTHGAYVRCAAQQASAALVNKSCGGAVRRCAARSTCGKPGFVTCCRTSRTGKSSCALKPGATKCVAPTGGRACAGSAPSCCDTCDAGTCTVTTTTSSSTTSSTLECHWFPRLECVGSCGGGLQCGLVGFEQCGCVPATNPCGSSGYPTCGGGCADPGMSCYPYAIPGVTTGCSCALTGMPCCSPDGAECPPGSVCQVSPTCGCVGP